MNYPPVIDLVTQVLQALQELLFVHCILKVDTRVQAGQGRLILGLVVVKDLPRLLRELLVVELELKRIDKVLEVGAQIVLVAYHPQTLLDYFQREVRTQEENQSMEITGLQSFLFLQHWYVGFKDFLDETGSVVGCGYDEVVFPEEDVSPLLYTFEANKWKKASKWWELCRELFHFY